MTGRRNAITALVLVCLLCTAVPHASADRLKGSSQRLRGLVLADNGRQLSVTLGNERISCSPVVRSPIGPATAVMINGEAVEMASMPTTFACEETKDGSALRLTLSPGLSDGDLAPTDVVAGSLAALHATYSVAPSGPASFTFTAIDRQAGSQVGVRDNCETDPLELRIGVAVDVGAYTVLGGTNDLVASWLQGTLDQASSVLQAETGIALTLDVAQLELRSMTTGSTTNEEWNAAPDCGFATAQEQLDFFSRWRAVSSGDTAAGMWILLTNCWSAAPHTPAHADSACVQSGTLTTGGVVDAGSAACPAVFATDEGCFTGAAVAALLPGDRGWVSVLHQVGKMLGVADAGSGIMKSDLLQTSFPASTRTAFCTALDEVVSGASNCLTVTEECAPVPGLSANGVNLGANFEIAVVGQTRVLECPAGFSGSVNRTCAAGGTFDPAMGDCIASAPCAASPSAVDAAGSDLEDAWPETSQGGEAELPCPDGFGSVTRFCGTNPSDDSPVWEDPVGVCVGSPCPETPGNAVDKNGVTLRQPWPETSRGEAVTLPCVLEDGYLGNIRRDCLGNGEWEGIETSEGFCRQGDCNVNNDCRHGGIMIIVGSDDPPDEGARCVGDAPNKRCECSDNFSGVVCEVQDYLTCVSNANCDGTTNVDCTVTQSNPTGACSPISTPICAPTDGLCCNNACPGVCRSCSVPGFEGVCTNPAPSDPELECDQFSCAESGGCASTCTLSTGCGLGRTCVGSTYCLHDTLQLTAPLYLVVSGTLATFDRRGFRQAVATAINAPIIQVTLKTVRAGPLSDQNVAVLLAFEESAISTDPDHNILRVQMMATYDASADATGTAEVGTFLIEALEEEEPTAAPADADSGAGIDADTIAIIAAASCCIFIMVLVVMAFKTGLFGKKNAEYADETSVKRGKKKKDKRGGHKGKKKDKRKRGRTEGGGGADVRLARDSEMQLSSYSYAIDPGYSSSAGSNEYGTGYYEYYGYYSQ